MSVTTDAIVLSLQPHSDKAHVLHAYTRAGGRVNYMVYGLGRKHPIGMYMPFSLVQITATNDPLKPPTIKEVTQLNHLTAKRSISEAVFQRKRSNSASDPTAKRSLQTVRPPLHR